MQMRESRLDSSGVCADCRKADRRTPLPLLHGAYVVIWISGTHIVGGGVFNHAKPTSYIHGGTPTVVASFFNEKPHLARQEAREWYERELPSVSRAFPILTFF